MVLDLFLIILNSFQMLYNVEDDFSSHIGPFWTV